MRSTVSSLLFLTMPFTAVPGIEPLHDKMWYLRTFVHSYVEAQAGIYLQGGQTNTNINNNNNNIDNNINNDSHVIAPNPR